jgi:hypothetical protein
MYGWEGVSVRWCDQVVDPERSVATCDGTAPPVAIGGIVDGRIGGTVTACVSV